ncbi:MAG: RNA-binding protein [Halobacteriales archaeon]|nr:RNA-binding protein [Halobacteriales archaeon]
MGSIPIHYVDVRAFCFATEDDARVESALRTLLPEDQVLTRETSQGHHGDRIVVLSARIENADGIRATVDRIRGIDEIDRVRAELDRRVDDDCALFIRFDKQAAFQGRVRLGEGILVRVKIEAYPARREAAIDNARAVLTG